MGKSANASGGQAKEKGDAAAKAGQAKEAKASKGKETAAASGKGKEQPKDQQKEQPKAESAAEKLAEEARQKWADDDREESTRVELRDQNRQTKASGAKELTGKRDKSVVRVTRFQNRLRLFKGESELGPVMSDIDGVDASKYVVELADCIMEAAGVTLKLKELITCVKVCSKLYATYDEFVVLLGKSLEKAYRATPVTDGNRRRFLLRLCAELSLVECLPAEKSLLLEMVRELSDVTQAEEQVVTNFTVLASLVQKHAVACLNIVPAKQKAYEEALGKPWVVRKCVLGDALRVQLTQLIVNAYQASAPGLLQGAHSRLIEQEKINGKLRIDKGQVDPESEQKHQTLKDNFQKLQSNLGTLSEYLNQPLPVPQEEDPGAVRLAGRVEAKEVPSTEDDLQLVWEDSEQQRFYEELIDLKEVIPAVLLSCSGKATATIDEKEAGDEKAAKKEDVEKQKDRKVDGKYADKGQQEAKPGMTSDLELYLMRVTQAETAKQVDDLACEFFHDFNTKVARRNLASQLWNVPRNSLHLLPAHARFIAVVAPFLKEVSNYVLQGLQQELEQLVAEKDPAAIESKVKTVRYLCELCKFKICPPGVILDAFKTLCDDFSQHHAELCANILQCCGRFLLYTPETAMRTDNLLERMMRLKNVKTLPLRLEVSLEDAYYQMKPPEGKRQKMKEKNPIELFIQHIIYERLYKDDDEDKVLKLVRKLTWTDETPGYLKKCILELNMHANYESLYQLASLLSGLAKYRDSFVIDVIDALLENIQTGAERNDFRESPIRVRQAKLLGELYNYRLVDSNLVFDTMYHFIGIGGPTIHRAGHTATIHKVLAALAVNRKAALGAIAEEGAREDVSGLQLPAVIADPQHPLEPPWDFFRIKLVCVILDTCGHYFDRGAVKQKLDRFLHFFIRYVHSKGELPLRVMFMVNDTLDRVRPKMVLPATLAEADEIVLDLLQAERDTLDLTDEREIDEREAMADEEDDSSDEDESGSEEDEDSSSEEDDSEDEETSEESDADDLGEYDRGDVGHTKHAEEIDEFDREVQQMLIESLEREKQQQAKRMLTDLPAPPPVAKRPEGASDPGVVSLLQRPRGGKMTIRQIEIPEDSKLLRAAQAKPREECKEKEEVKRYIMHYDQMSSLAGLGSLSGAGGGPQQQRQPYNVVQRAGKGGQKGGAGFGFDPRSRRNDYVQDGFLVEDDAAEPPARVRIVQGGRGKGSGAASGGTAGAGGGRGSGRGGSGGTGLGGGSGLGGSSVGSVSNTPAGAGSAAGGRRRPEPFRGTPSSATGKGSL